MMVRMVFPFAIHKYTLTHHVFVNVWPFYLPTPSCVEKILPLVSRKWKNGSNSSYNCTPFLHPLLTKGKMMVEKM